MITVWRLTRKKYAGTAFSGEGARYNAARWHSGRYPVVYTSGSLSLALVETIVQMDPAHLPKMVVVSANIPDKVAMESVKIKTRPSHWRQFPGPTELKEMGNAWFEKGKTAVLKVPSAVVPGEYNYLINPLHPDFTKIAIGKPESFSLDPRLLK